MAEKGQGAVAQATYCITTESFAKIAEEKTPTLLARDYKNPPVLKAAGRSTQSRIECLRHDYSHSIK